MRLLLLILVALVVAPASSAMEVRLPELTQATAIASGTAAPDVSCESYDVAWDAEARSVGSSGAALAGYTYPAQRRVRLAPWVCRSLDPADPNFGFALHVVAGEAGRVAGVSDDGMNGCYGLLWVADLARRVWGIPFFTKASDRVIAQALSGHRNNYAPRYRTLCR